jgi:hypothetical protein
MSAHNDTLSRIQKPFRDHIHQPPQLKLNGVYFSATFDRGLVHLIAHMSMQSRGVQTKPVTGLFGVDARHLSTSDGGLP